MTRSLLAILAFYRRWLSPALHSLGTGGCRYQPTCSEYAEVAIATHGCCAAIPSAAAVSTTFRPNSRIPFAAKRGRKPFLPTNRYHRTSGGLKRCPL